MPRTTVKKTTAKKTASKPPAGTRHIHALAFPSLDSFVETIAKRIHALNAPSPELANLAPATTKPRGIGLETFVSDMGAGSKPSRTTDLSMSLYDESTGLRSRMCRVNAQLRGNGQNTVTDPPADQMPTNVNDSLQTSLQNIRVTYELINALVDYIGIDA